MTNLTRWPLFGFVVGVAEPEAFAEDPTWWRRHRGIVTVAARLAWVLIALNVVRLSIMVPLYLAEQVAALGVAKVVLGWPAYLLAITAMGAILVRGRTPIDPRRTAGDDRRPERRGPHRLTVRSRRRPSVVPLARRDELLEAVLLLRRRDEEQLVAGLDRVVGRGRDRPLLADDRDEHRVGRPVDVDRRARPANGAAVGQRELDHVGAALVERRRSARGRRR